MKNSEEGYGLFETLISMAAILLVSAACATVIFSVVKGMAAAERKNSQSIELLEADNAIREWVESIHVPYWAPPQKTVKKQLAAFAEKDTQYTIIQTRIEYTAGMPAGITITYKINGDPETHITTAAIPCRGVLRDQ